MSISDYVLQVLKKCEYCSVPYNDTFFNLFCNTMNKYYPNQYIKNIYDELKKNKYVCEYEHCNVLREFIYAQQNINKNKIYAGELIFVMQSDHKCSILLKQNQNYDDFILEHVDLI